MCISNLVYLSYDDARQSEDKSLIVGMTDGLLSIRDRRSEKKPDGGKAAEKTIVGNAGAAAKYNPYKYVSPSLATHNSPVFIGFFSS